MTVVPGTKLGPYVVEAPLGAGGMGEVWKARDTRLDRLVAIKFAAEQFSRRFEREARAVAALNHPHICTVYDVGPNYLVMELVEGQPLTGPLPLDRALPLATQILSALDAAHRKGITHRDLKPANILVTRQGVKLLDFGLAKVSPGAEPAGPTERDQTRELSESMMERSLTGEHTILGTVAYMSPEQAQGKPADARSDIFSFGLVLYEMLTGRRAFDGANPASVSAAILERDAPSLAGVAPPALDRVLRKCLAKDPDERFQTARDLKSALEWTTDEVPAGPARNAGTWWPAVAAGALAVLSMVALAGWWRAATAANPAPTSAVPLDIYVGAALLPTNVGTDAILSPDGTRIVFVSQGADGASHLRTRRLDQPEAVELSRTDGAQGPFFSPDGMWVGFFAGGKLKKVRLDGGDPVVLCDAPAARGGSWSETGNIIAALDIRSGLSQVSADGGRPVILTKLQVGDNSHRWPQVLAGGTHVLFTIGHAFSNYAESDVAVLSLADQQIKTVLPRAGLFPRYARGMLTYVTKGRLVAVPFDSETMETRGQARLVLEDVSNNTNYGFAQVDFSADGMLLYRKGRTEGLRTLEWMEASGKTVLVTSEPGNYLFPRVSPDGSRLLWTANENASADVWLQDVQRGGRARLTSGTGVNSYPVWSPDGQFVVFSSGVGGIYWTRADGAGKPQALTETTTRMQLPSSFAPDGKRLAYSDVQQEGGASIQTLAIDYEAGQLRPRHPELFLRTSSGAPFPAFSPDGRWLAYADSESGRYEVYVRAFPDRGTKWQISNSGGTMPLWSRNGRELFYRTEDSQVMVADYTMRGDAFVAQKPRLWSERRLANTGLSLNLDLAPAGDRLLALMPVGSSEPSGPQGHVMLVLNPFERHR